MPINDIANAGVTLTAVKGCLVATLHADLHDQAFEQIRNATLDKVVGTGAISVIFDMSAVRLLDCHEYAKLGQLLEMLRLLGCRTMLVGISAGVVAYLVSQDVDIRHIHAERGLEEAFDRLIPRRLQGA